MRFTSAVLIVACLFAAILAGCRSSAPADEPVARSAWQPEGLDLNEKPAIEEPATVEQLEDEFAAEEADQQVLDYTRAEPSPSGPAEVQSVNAGDRDEAQVAMPPRETRIVEASGAPVEVQTVQAESVTPISAEAEQQAQQATAQPVDVTPVEPVRTTPRASAPSPTPRPQPRRSEPVVADASRADEASTPSATAGRSSVQTEAALPSSSEAATQSAEDQGPDPFATRVPRPVRPPIAVDAMIGQVNGRALYASRVLEPLEPGLEAMAAEMSPAAFRARAAELIHGRLVQIVADALILGEAERNLNAAQRQALRAHLSRYRASLLRQGLGSVELTEQIMQEKHGKTLEQMIEDERQKQVVRAYLQEKLFPKIYVSRKMVERYYQDNIDEFQPKPKRTIRLIRVTKEGDAKRLGQALEQGKPFEEVAADPANLYKPRQGGLLGEVTGDKPLRHDELNEAIGQLGPQERSRRIEVGGAYWWIYADSVEYGESRTLQEAQLDIEQAMRESQFQRLTRDYREKLFETGSYNPLEEMTIRLVDIATSRYVDLPDR